jgi:hypothetical protein
LFATHPIIVIEHVTTPTRRYYMKATWDPTSHLEVCREVDYEADETGPEAESEVIYHVPVDRIAELVAAAPIEAASVDELLAWARESSDNATLLDRALSTLDPTTVVFSRLHMH